MSLSAGQRCLSILEIGRRVAYELSNLEDSEWSDLLNLAFTCRALREPALDEYWYEVEDIDDLMREMPRQLWDPEENAEDVGVDEENDEGSAKVHIPG
jgi:hypothetical protein